MVRDVTNQPRAGEVTVAGEQMLIGLVTTGLCTVGLAKESWFLRETRKGRWLVATFGSNGALWMLRGLLSAGIVFGLALATGVVNPIRW